MPCGGEISWTGDLPPPYFARQAGKPGQWLNRVRARAHVTDVSWKTEAAARVLLITGGAEAWVHSEEGKEALRRSLEEASLRGCDVRAPAEHCPIAWAAGGKGACEGRSLWVLFGAVARTCRWRHDKSGTL